MKKNSLYKAWVAAALLVVSACSAPRQEEGISLEKMHGFPTGDAGFFKGVSALYAGMIDGQLLIGGGCNFPDVPVADGGQKVFYGDVYVAPLTGDTVFSWKRVGELPEASAYGVTISTEHGLICIGGTTATNSLASVYSLSLQGDTLLTDTLPALPVTMDNMAGAELGGRVYVVGGNVDGVPSSAMYSLDLAHVEQGWQKEVSFPGGPRVQPVCVAQSGCLYVWGGFVTAGEGREASLSLDGYRFVPATGEWQPVAVPADAEGETVSLGGGTVVPWGDHCILCTGGVNKNIFLKALQGIYAGKEYLSHPVEWYQFNDRWLLYNTTTDQWTTLGRYSQGARAGAAMVMDGEEAYIINGELKPGIRTNEINRIKKTR